MANDIAMMKLNSPVSIDTVEYKIVPACIPARTNTYEGRTAWVTGYGKLS
jgi:hypothetical protein